MIVFEYKEIIFICMIWIFVLNKKMLENLNLKIFNCLNGRLSLKLFLGLRFFISFFRSYFIMFL